MALSAAKAKKILEDGYVKSKPLTAKQKKYFGAIADGATPLKKLNGGWLDKFQNGGDVSFDSVQRAIRNVESLDGKLMWNPESTATGLYGQLFSQVKDDYSGTREEFAKDTISQKKFFKDRFFKGLPSTQTTSLVQDANDIYNEYAPQISNFNYSKEDLAVLSNFLGRQGTREYLGYHVRDNQPLEKALPNIYGSDAKQRNKTPEQYLKQARKYYKEGGWLDKFDNGGVQPNYNDSNVSLPPGFKGWGYDKGGRAYNGAWNGPVAQEGIELNTKYIDSTFNANMDKRWVQRLYERNPEFYLEGQTKPSTHFMESGDGYVYPRVMEGADGQLKEVSREEGRSQGIKFPNDEIAQWFAKNYKKGTNVLKEYQMGGSLSGATGMMYARTSGTSPEEPKKAQDGGWLDKFQEGGVIEDNRGQWAYPGEITKINSNNITMKGVNYPVLGISDTGDRKMMQPGKDYKFKGNSVTEFPMARDGKSLVELNQLTNFTNYNTPQPGGWLDKY